MNGFLKALRGKPLAIINVGFLLIISSMFIYLMVKPIDVLQDWHVTLVETPKDGQQHVIYNPNTSLIFNSSSNKVSTAKGTTSRYLECRDESGNEISVQIDKLPATRPEGIQPTRANQIIVPDTSQFDGLPKTCKLVIDIFYENVVLWRDHNEHAETQEFVVDLPSLSREELNEKIMQLEQELESLRHQQSPDTNPPPVLNSAPPSETTVVKTPQDQPNEPEPIPEEEVQDCSLDVLFIHLFCN